MSNIKAFDPAEDVRLLSVNYQPFKSLSGYQKHHRVPQVAGDAEIRMLHTISVAEIDADLEAVFGRLRHEFGFKRKELVASDVESGCGMIETPFFSYEVNVELDESEPGTVCFRRVIANIREPNQLFGEAFQKVFDSQFSTLQVTAPEPLDVESVIDLIEDAEPENVVLSYDKDATWCELKFTDSQAQVRVDAETIRVSTPGAGSPQTLFETFLSVRQHFEEALSFGDVWQ